MRWTPAYHTACKIQDKILAKIGIVRGQPKHGPAPELPPQAPLSAAELASLTKAWETLEERKRIIRMKPKPRDQAVKEKDDRPKRAVFSE